MVLQYNLTQEAVDDIAYFDNDEDALKWIDFILENQAHKVIYNKSGRAKYVDKAYDTIKVHLRTV